MNEQEREKFDEKSLRHYDTSVQVYKVSLFTLLLTVIGYLFKGLFVFGGFSLKNKIFFVILRWISLGWTLFFLTFIVGMIFMLLFVYDFYIGQNRRKKKLLNENKQKNKK